MEEIVWITEHEGGELMYFFKTGLTKEQILSWPIEDKYPSTAWGGWIHSFYTVDFDKLELKRYDSVNNAKEVI